LAVAGLDAEKVEHYLKSLLGKDIELVGLAPLGEPPDEVLGKSYGYGAPVCVDYRAANGERLFANGVGFRQLDRSRGEYGDPAGVVTSITLNYVFFSARRKILTFMLSVIESPAFDPTQVNEYCGV
jgi:hypothetical protein